MLELGGREEVRMPDDAQEQIPDVASEQSAPAAEQAPEPVAESEVSAVAEGDDGAVAESEVPAPSFDFSNPDHARQVLEDPTYKGFRDLILEARADAENTTKQKLEADLRRQQASDEVLAQAARNLALELGVDAEDERVKGYAQAFTRPFVERNQIELNKLYINAAKSAFSPDAQVAIDMAVQAAGDDVESLGSVVTQLWQYRDQVSREDAVSGLSLEQVSEGSKLHKEIQERIQKEVEAELKARETAANRIDPGPSATHGSAPGTVRSEELETILRTAHPNSQQYRDAYREKWGFELASAR